MCSILLIHKPHYRQQGRVHEGGTGITVEVSCEECSSYIRKELLVGESRDDVTGHVLYLLSQKT